MGVARNSISAHHAWSPLLSRVILSPAAVLSPLSLQCFPLLPVGTLATQPTRPGCPEDPAVEVVPCILWACSRANLCRGVLGLCRGSCREAGEPLRFIRCMNVHCAVRIVKKKQLLYDSSGSYCHNSLWRFFQFCGVRWYSTMHSSLRRLARPKREKTLLAGAIQQALDIVDSGWCRLQYSAPVVVRSCLPEYLRTFLCCSLSPASPASQLLVVLHEVQLRYIRAPFVGALG